MSLNSTWSPETWYQNNRTAGYGERWRLPSIHGASRLTSSTVQCNGLGLSEERNQSQVHENERLLNIYLYLLRILSMNNYYYF